MGVWTDIPNCTWQGPTPNHSGPMLEQRGQVLHIAEGGYEGTISWCKNPASNVSCHFVVAKDGRIAQVADTDVTVWTQIAGNGHWISVENEGFTPGPLTAAQVEANAQILAKAHRVYGVPLQLAFDPTGRGLGHHSMGTDGHDNPTDTWTGATWGHTDCPGPAIYAQKPAIVARAQEIVDGPKPQEDDMIAHLWRDTNHQQWYVTGPLQVKRAVSKAEADTIRYYAGGPGLPGFTLVDLVGNAQGDADPAVIPGLDITHLGSAGTVELTPEQVAQISGAAHDGAAGAIDGATVSGAVISTKKS